MSDLQYPIGRFQPPQKITSDDRRSYIKQIEEAPLKLRAAVAGLDEAQLNTPYRDGGWMVRQVVHHLADSHMNAFIRFKLALTENEPPVKPYDQELWADLPDAKVVSVETSLALLEALHKRFAQLLTSMGSADFARTMNHPELGIVTLDHYLSLYAWHGRHHVAHITSLRERKGWK